jgi:hypothetical protein
MPEEIKSREDCPFCSQRWAIDYKKKMEKMKKSIDPKVWEYIYESPEY